MNFKIFPATLTSDGKKIPLIHNWYEQATTDLVQIQKWQHEFGSQLTLWGIPTGSVNGIVAVDIDVKHGNGFQSAQQAGLNLPTTQAQRTLSGGAHFVYRLPEGVQLRNTVGSFAESVDTRGEGGWIAYYGLDQTPIADAPEWLLRGPKVEVYDRKGANFTIAPDLAREMLETICSNIVCAPAGTSNNVLNEMSFQAAQMLIGTNSLSREEVLNRLFQAAKERGKPDYEARATIMSGVEAGLQVDPLYACPFEPKPVVSMETPSGRWTPAMATFDQLTDFRRLKREQLFKHWSSRDIQLISGDGGTGKTTLEIMEAICLALGERFLGFECIKPGKTLFVIGEDDEVKILAMIGAACRQMKLNENQMEIIRRSIYVKKDTDLCLITKDKSGFLKVNGWATQKLQQAVEDLKPDNIVFDPIASFWGSESALNDMAIVVTKFMGWLRDISGASVRMVNHIGKASSQLKDISQFAGRGGSGLPSHSRIVKVLRRVDANEFQKLTGRMLQEGETGVFGVVSKHTDDPTMLDKPFMIIRRGYLFERIELNPAVLDEREDDPRTDVEVVHDFMITCLQNKLYPTMGVIVASLRDVRSKERVIGAVNLLIFKDFQGHKIKKVDNPDLTSSEKVYVLTDIAGQELNTY